jgi:hypothetical protein
MTSFISTYSLNLINLKLVDGYYTKSEDWDDLICENEGSFSKDEEYMIFNLDGLEVVINYELSVNGRVQHDPGDYWTPSYTEVDIIDEDITISSVTIDDYELELNKEIESLLEKEIKKNL